MNTSIYQIINRVLEKKATDEEIIEYWNYERVINNTQATKEDFLMFYKSDIHKGVYC